MILSVVGQLEAPAASRLFPVLTERGEGMTSRWHGLKATVLWRLDWREPSAQSLLLVLLLKGLQGTRILPVIFLFFKRMSIYTT